MPYKMLGHSNASKIGIEDVVVEMIVFLAILWICKCCNVIGTISVYTKNLYSALYINNRSSYYLYIAINRLIFIYSAVLMQNLTYCNVVCTGMSVSFILFCTADREEILFLIVYLHIYLSLYATVL